MPKKISKISLTIIVLAAGIVLAGTLKFFFKAEMPAFLKNENPRAKGNPKSSFQVVEYIDFQCPACAKGSEILRLYIDQHSDQIHLQMKYFPLGGHAHAFTSARYAQCAARQGKFWEFHDLLIGRQAQWKALVNALPQFRKMAEEVRLNIPQLDQCLQDEKLDVQINQEKEEGKRLGVTQTPTYFINGEMIVGTKSLIDTLSQKFGKPDPEDVSQETINLFKQ